MLIVHEDSRTGGIGESLAAIIQEEAFEWLDAPVRIIGALDTPVPYSPPLEDAFLPSEAEIERAARLLVQYLAASRNRRIHIQPRVRQSASAWLPLPGQVIDRSRRAAATSLASAG